MTLTGTYTGTFVRSKYWSRLQAQWMTTQACGRAGRGRFTTASSAIARLDGSSLSLPSASSFSSFSSVRRKPEHNVDFQQAMWCCRIFSRHYSQSSIVSKKDYPPYTLYPLPALSPTMAAGTIASWSKAEGDSFSAGEVLCTIETDKASVDFEAQDEGILAKILRQGPTGQDVPVGTPICVIVDDAKDVPAFADFALAAEATPITPQTTDVPAVDTSSSTSQAASDSTDGSHAILFPAARHLAESNSLDATHVKGTGKGGRITKGDVLLAMQAGSLPTLSAIKPKSVISVPAPASAPPSTVTTTTQTQPSTPSPPKPSPSSSIADFVVAIPTIETAGPYEDVPNNKMRKIIAKRLTESKSQVPHFYAAMQIHLDPILALRKKLASEHDLKVSVNDFIIRCCALALRDIPEVNGTYNAATDSLQFHDSIDVSVAVATPTGLITPIVFNTDKLGLAEITSKVKDLAARARIGKLAPHEYQGGTFSISNLGMFGIDEFCAVINPPQAAILAVGGGSRRVIVPTLYEFDDAPKQKRQAAPKIQTIMTASLSADRRVVDEATASLFLSAFRQYMNEPTLLLL